MKSGNQAVGSQYNTAQIVDAVWAQCRANPQMQLGDAVTAVFMTIARDASY
jgi:hypothetical protein